ncbi:MAG TPA: hypothetical protein VFV38_36155, partial [Ktedonobacteraceae bacterium]|nr:hypothetical protein [Ktedonobacteraceae bacterium]
ALRQNPSFNYSLLYAQAILHHPVFEAMIYSGGVRVRGDYSSRGKQFIEKIPVRMVDIEDTNDREKYDRIVQLVQQLIAVIAKLSQAKLPAEKKTLERLSDLLKSQINEVVSALYGIGEEDLRLIEDLRKIKESSERG